MTKRNLLLISGKIFSGKDFTANLLVKQNTWKKLSLADDLKTICSMRYNTDIMKFHTHEGKMSLYDKTKTHRDLLIETSKEIKKQNKNFFVERVIDKIDKIKGYNVVIPDFRFPHEYEKLNNDLSCIFNVNTCVVTRDNSVKLEDYSENALTDFKFDFTIVNDRDETKILKQIENFYKYQA